MTPPYWFDADGLQHRSSCALTRLLPAERKTAVCTCHPQTTTRETIWTVVRGEDFQLWWAPPTAPKELRRFVYALNDEHDAREYEIGTMLTIKTTVTVEKVP